MKCLLKCHVNFLNVCCFTTMADWEPYCLRFILKGDTGNPLTFKILWQRVNMASLADVGWKLLEFKARSKRSGLTFFTLHYTVQYRPIVPVVPALCVRLSVCKAAEHGLKFDLICPFNLSTAVTVQAWKVRGVNVQHPGSILRAFHQVSFRCYVSPVINCVLCMRGEQRACVALWKLADCVILALVVSLHWLSACHLKKIDLIIKLWRLSYKQTSQQLLFITTCRSNKKNTINYDQVFRNSLTLRCTL